MFNGFVVPQQILMYQGLGFRKHYCEVSFPTLAGATFFFGVELSHYTDRICCKFNDFLKKNQIYMYKLLYFFMGFKQVVKNTRIFFSHSYFVNSQIWLNWLMNDGNLDQLHHKLKMKNTDQEHFFILFFPIMWFQKFGNVFLIKISSKLHFKTTFE